MALRIAALIVNIALGVIVWVYWGRMALHRDDSGKLSAEGLRSLKYFTVLSNLLEGAAALVYAVCVARVLLGAAEGIPRWVQALKYAAAVSVGLTFLTVIVYLGPKFGYKNMFLGSNLWFHLLVPVAAVLSFCLLERDGALPFAASFLAVLPMVLYGIGYVINLLLHGLGEGEDTHDWYGFAQGGAKIAAMVFAGMILTTWGFALLLRLARL